MSSPAPTWRARPRTRAILDVARALRDRGAPITSRAIADALDLRVSTVRPTVLRLEERGVVREVRRGWPGRCAVYALTEG